MNGRPGKVATATRPDTMWPEDWQKQEEIEAWGDEKTRAQEARFTMDECSGKPEAMNVGKRAGTKGKPQQHLAHISEKRHVSEFHLRYGA